MAQNRQLERLGSCSSRILSWVAPKANAPHWGLTAVTRHLYVPGCKLPAGNSMRNMAVSPVTAIAGGSALKTLWSDEKHCSDDRICLASQPAPPSCVAAAQSTWYCIAKPRFTPYSASGFKIRRDPFRMSGDLGELELAAASVPLNNELTDMRD